MLVKHNIVNEQTFLKAKRHQQRAYTCSRGGRSHTSLFICSSHKYLCVCLTCFLLCRHFFPHNNVAKLKVNVDVKVNVHQKYTYSFIRAFSISYFLSLFILATHHIFSLTLPFVCHHSRCDIESLYTVSFAAIEILSGIMTVYIVSISSIQ